MIYFLDLGSNPDISELSLLKDSPIPSFFHSGTSLCFCLISKIQLHGVNAESQSVGSLSFFLLPFSNMPPCEQAL